MIHTTLHSVSSELVIGFDRPFVIVGEKINPSGRPALSSALLTADFAMVQAEALAQVAAGASVIDVNVCVSGVDEVQLLADVVIQLQDVIDVPLCLDSASVEALQQGAAAYRGKPLINSVTGTEQSMGEVFPIVAKHGAAIIALTMDETGISSDPEIRYGIAKKIVQRAADYGIAKADVLIDPLVLPAAGGHANVRQLLPLIGRLRRDLQVNTICGASNASFGLPNRAALNAAFLPMLMGAGMTAAIANPLQSEVAIGVKASEVLLGLDAGGESWVSRHS